MRASVYRCIGAGCAECLNRCIGVSVRDAPSAPIVVSVYRCGMRRVFHSVYRCIGAGCAECEMLGVSVYRCGLRRVPHSVYRCIGAGCAKCGAIGVSVYRCKRVVCASLGVSVQDAPDLQTRCIGVTFKYQDPFPPTMLFLPKLGQGVRTWYVYATSQSQLVFYDTY